MFKNKIVLFVVNSDETMLFVMDKSKPKRGLQYQMNLLYLSGVHWDKSDLQFV